MWQGLQQWGNRSPNLLLPLYYPYGRGYMKKVTAKSIFKDKNYMRYIIYIYTIYRKGIYIMCEKVLGFFCCYAVTFFIYKRYGKDYRGNSKIFLLLPLLPFFHIIDVARLAEVTAKFCYLLPIEKNNKEKM
jgi:hypothetical protein